LENCTRFSNERRTSFAEPLNPHTFYSDYSEKKPEHPVHKGILPSTDYFKKDRRFSAVFARRLTVQTSQAMVVLASLD
jgi:hypothetical protein